MKTEASPIPTKPLTAGQVPELDRWLEWNLHNRGHAGTTVSNYRSAILAWAQHCAGLGVDVRQATPEQLQRFAGGVLHARGLSSATRRIWVSALRGYYRWLARCRQVPESPAADLPYPKLGRSLPVPISLTAAEKMLAACDLDSFKGVRDVAILAVLLGCGPRVSGVSALNEGDLIFTRSDGGIEQLTIKFREKGKNERYVPAPEETRLLLRAYLGHEDLEGIDRRLPSGDRVLFVNLANSRTWLPDWRGEARRLQTWSVWQMVKEYGAAAGIDPRMLHPHAFRHLYGQELIEADVHLLTAQKLMGHADPKSTEIYAHIAFRKLRKAAEDASPMRRIKSPATGLAALMRKG